MNEQIDIVLPLARFSHGHDEISRATILLESLEKHCHSGFIRYVWVVSEPGKTMVIARRLIERYKLDLQFMDEQELIGNETNISGWRKQQLVKLAAYRITTPFYLVVDADCICHSPFDKTKLLPDGRGLVSQDRKTTHPQWWEQSSKKLQIPINWETPGISVTPQVLCKEIVLRMKEHIELLYSHCWLKVLGTSECWTEFTAYDLVARHYDLFDRYHVFGQLTGNNLWKEGNSEAWQLDPKATGFFSVVQSNSGISPEQVRKQIKIST